jgi:hypothetical protein
MVNGRFWNSLNLKSSKGYFLLGFREGIKSGVDHFADIDHEKVKEKVTIAVMLFPSNQTMTTDDLIDSLNRFYSIAANRPIAITRALVYINAEATGLLKAGDLADMLTDLRQEAVQAPK